MGNRISENDEFSFTVRGNKSTVTCSTRVDNKNGKCWSRRRPIKDFLNYLFSPLSISRQYENNEQRPIISMNKILYWILLSVRLCRRRRRCKFIRKSFFFFEIFASIFSSVFNSVGSHNINGLVEIASTMEEFSSWTMDSTFMQRGCVKNPTTPIFHSHCWSEMNTSECIWIGSLRQFHWSPFAAIDEHKSISPVNWPKS